MNLKRRLILANAATVVIPIMITVFVASAYIFFWGKFLGTDTSFEDYQKFSELKLELITSEKSMLKQTPEILEKESFQRYLQDRLAAINGELIILKDERVLFASDHFNKIDLAKIMDPGKVNAEKKTVEINNLSYTVEIADFSFKDGVKGRMALLAPLDRSGVNLTALLLWLGIIFGLAFAGTTVLISYQFSRTILKPLKNIQTAAAEISRGNLDYQIVEEGDREIQALCRDLELMRLKLKDSIYTQLKFEENRKMLISSISHDLKTPVTSIKGYVEGIFDGIANTPEKMDRYLKTIYLKAEQVDQMIDDLLLYAKLDLNQIPFNFERTEIAEYLKACLAESEPELESSQIKVGFVNELRQPHFVQLDRERMKRVLMNILDNSRKYMDKAQGEIKVLLRETNSSIIIELRDNGSGIKESDLPYIFDRFYRSDPARTEIKGSGLGLAIAKQLVEGHHGRVWAVSHGNEGTSIMISLPKS